MSIQIKMGKCEKKSLIGSLVAIAWDVPRLADAGDGLQMRRYLQAY
jgi:hypothetical protein